MDPFDISYLKLENTTMNKHKSFKDVAVQMQQLHCKLETEKYNYEWDCLLAHYIDVVIKLSDNLDMSNVSPETQTNIQELLCLVEKMNED